MSYRLRMIAILGGLGVGLTLLNVVLLAPRYTRQVRIETVAKKPLARIVRAAATVEAKRSITLKAEIDGPVIKKSFKEGQPIQQGDLLLILSRDKIRLNYDKQVITVENAKSDLLKARKDVRIQKELYAKEAVALSNVEDAKRAAVRAEQDLKTAEESLRQEKQLWEKDKISAPFAGVVVKDSLGEDLFVNSGREIATLADVSELTVVARVDELEIQQIRPGQLADVRLQAYGDRPFAAKVIDIGSQATGDTVPEVAVTLKLLDILGVDLRPKMTAVAKVITGHSPDIVSVPLTALSNQGGQTRVWVVSSSGRLLPREVKIGMSNPDRAEITEGLSAGERVCVTQDPAFAKGLRVNIDRSIPSLRGPSLDPRTSPLGVERKPLTQEESDAMRRKMQEILNGRRDSKSGK